MSRAARIILSSIRPALAVAASAFSNAAKTTPNLQETEKQEFNRLAAQKKQLKSEIIEFGPAFPMPETDHLTSPAIIAASIFSKHLVDEEDKKRLLKNIEATYAVPMMKPKMDLIALSCLGKANQDDSEKKFKIVAAKEMADFHPRFSDKVGNYTNKNTAFVKLPDLRELDAEKRDKAIDYFWIVAIHEATHFAMKRTFGRHSPPHDAEFNEMILATISRIEALDPKKKENSFPCSTMKDAITLYPYEKYGAEFIARVPEIIFQNPKGGYEWLQKNTPELLKYFEEEINPAINDFLRKKEAGKYLSSETKPDTARVGIVSASGLSQEKPKQLS